MKLLRFVCLFCAVIFGSTAMAQSQDELQQLMRNRGEYYFTLSVDSPSVINEISQVCSVDATDGRTVVAYASKGNTTNCSAWASRPSCRRRLRCAMKPRCGRVATAPPTNGTAI